MLTFKNLAAALALGAVCVAAVPIADAAEVDKWDGQDKKLHLIAGVAIGSAVTAYTKSPAKGVFAGVTVGVLKEFSDWNSEGHTASIKDAVATALGAIAGSYVTGLIVVPGAVWYQTEW